MATATKIKQKRQQQEREELVKTTAAAKRLKMTRQVVYQMIALGYFTERRSNPIYPESHRMIYADEIDRYLELLAQGLKQDRIKAAMEQYRFEAGRIADK